MSTSESGRIIAPDRLARWQTGRGRLSAAEVERLSDISSQAPKIKNLGKSNEEKTQWKVNRAMRDWLAGGKAKGEALSKDPVKLAKQRKAAKGLGYLGVDTGDGTYYVKKRK